MIEIRRSIAREGKSRVKSLGAKGGKRRLSGNWKRKYFRKRPGRTDKFTAEWLGEGRDRVGLIEEDMY